MMRKSKSSKEVDERLKLARHSNELCLAGEFSWIE